MIQNKKGLSSVGVFTFIFAAFFVILFLGIILFIFTQINSVLDQDLDIGQVNLQDVNDQTFGQINTAFVNNADNLGIIAIFGMALLMILNSFVIGREYPKIFLMIDFIILIAVFIVAVYLSQTYDTYIHAFNLLETIYVDDLPKSSTFVLKLPWIVGTLGALIIIFTYSGLNKENEDINVQNF